MAEKRSPNTQELPTQPNSEGSSTVRTEPVPDRYQVHVVINNKGGIGKTIVAMELVQFLRDKRQIKVQAIDLDPMNHTLAEYTGLAARSVGLLAAGHVDLKGQDIDALAQTMLTEDASFVIDNGSAGFVRFGEYLMELDFAAMLAERGRDLVIHAVVAGGDMAAQCVLGLSILLQSFPPPTRFVAWLNEHSGPVELDGIGFEQMAIYRDNAMRFAGLVRLPRLSPLFLADFNKMLQRRLTYEEAIASSDFLIMNKQRLVMTRRAVWQQLEGII